MSNQNYQKSIIREKIDFSIDFSLKIVFFFMS